MFLPLMQTLSLSLHMAKFEVANQPEPYIFVLSSIVRVVFVSRKAAKSQRVDCQRGNYLMRVIKP